MQTRKYLICRSEGFPLAGYFIPAHVGVGGGVGWGCSAVAVAVAVAAAVARGPIFDENMIFSDWVFLVGKMILDLVGVF